MTRSSNVRRSRRKRNAVKPDDALTDNSVKTEITSVETKKMEDIAFEPFPHPRINLPNSYKSLEFLLSFKFDDC